MFAGAAFVGAVTRKAPFLPPSHLLDVALLASPHRKHLFYLMHAPPPHNPHTHSHDNNPVLVPHDLPASPLPACRRRPRGRRSRLPPPPLYRYVLRVGPLESPQHPQDTFSWLPSSSPPHTQSPPPPLPPPVACQCLARLYKARRCRPMKIRQRPRRASSPSSWPHRPCTTVPGQPLLLPRTTINNHKKQ